jgi:hypothetical protein
VQYLGDMPWISRATAVRPDANLMIRKLAKVKVRTGMSLSLASGA